MRQRAILRGALCVAALGAPPGIARAIDMPLPSADKRTECDVVEFGADIAHCDDEQCTLYDHAFVLCDDLKIWSDRMQVAWTPDRQFAGAQAIGNVLMVDGNKVLTCERVQIEKDGIRGRVEGATIRVKDPKKPGYRIDARGIPSGTDTSVLRGTFEVVSPEELTITNGSFTLCDCGEDPPSWQFEAQRIEAELGNRVTVWWPRIYLDLFGLGLRTPPAAPISIPLNPRAWGFLAPKIGFYSFPLPTIDLPLFMPLGESWDLTIAPGMRFDWINSHRIAPSRWGAPRVGGRLRYAPLKEVTGEANLQWTWDHKQYIARQYIKSVEASTGQEFTALLQGQDKELARLNRLTHRISLDFKQDVQFSDSMRWLIDVGWLSDDRIPRDFGFNLEQLVVDYIPSRSQLTWFHPRAAANISADFLQAIGNDGSADWEYSNLHGSELHTGHRGPAAQFTLLPMVLGQGLQVDGEASLGRHGAWHIEDKPALVVGGGQLGLGLARKFGPVSLIARAAGHGMWQRPALDDDVLLSFVHLRADAETTLARRYGQYLHTLTPALKYRGIPARRVFAGNDIAAPPDEPAACVWRNSAKECDQRLDAKIQHQGSVGLEQYLYTGAGRSLRPKASLEVSVPMDLTTGGLFPLRAESSWWTPLGRGSLWVGLQPNRDDEPLREIGARHSVRLRWFTLSGKYIRWAPDAERFTRSIYELASADDDAKDRPWVHSTTGSLSFSSEILRLSYRATVLLPMPGAAPDDINNNKRPFINQHVATASYTSPCNCWAVGATTSLLGYGQPAPGAESVPFGERFRAKLWFSIGGYALGN